MRPIYDLTSPAFVANPYPTYERLLAEAPVHRCPRTGICYLVRWRDVAGVLRHPAASVARSDRLIAGLPQEERDASRIVAEVLGRMALFRDPPEQSWLHRAIARPLSPRRMAALAPYLDAMADRLLDAVADARRMDVIADLAYPLPATVIAELLGADPADRDRFRRWSRDVTQLLGVPTDSGLARRATQSLGEAVDYFRPLVRRDPLPEDAAAPWRGVVLRELLGERTQHPRLHDDDIVAGCILMVFAGHETTTTLISNALLCLLRSPEQLARLRAEPALAAGAIDETLRYESPIQRTGRILRVPVEVDGVRIAAGEPVNLVLAAAHRDPAVFVDPGRFDIARPDIRHLAFGAGRHRCPGGALGTLEARAGLRALVRRLGEIEMAAPPRWVYNVAFRRLEAMPITFAPRARSARAATTAPA